MLFIEWMGKFMCLQGLEGQLQVILAKCRFKGNVWGDAVGKGIKR